MGESSKHGFVCAFHVFLRIKIGAPKGCLLVPGVNFDAMLMLFRFCLGNLVVPFWLPVVAFLLFGGRFGVPWVSCGVKHPKRCQTGSPNESILGEIFNFGPSF